MTTYRLQHDETLEEGVKRIVVELADEALGYLEEDDPAEIVEAIHETRKLCKKARGLARLVRPGLGGEYAAFNRQFRDAARALGPIRDPHALLDTFDDMASVPGLVDTRVAQTVRRELEKRSSQATGRVLGEESGRVERAANLIRSARARAGDWELSDEFDPIGGGTYKTYKRGRKRLADATDTRDADVFHQWRKRVKYLWYQVRLVRNSATSILRPLSNRLHDLSDALGDAHDLVVLQHELSGTGLDAHHQEVIGTVATGMRVNLEERALSLGLRLYVETPDDFVDRLEAYWDIWREHGDELEAGEIADLFPQRTSGESNEVAELFAIGEAEGGR